MDTSKGTSVTSCFGDASYSLTTQLYRKLGKEKSLQPEKLDLLRLNLRALSIFYLHTSHIMPLKDTSAIAIY